MKIDPFTRAARFGLGPRPADPAASDRASLAADLDTPAFPSSPALASTSDGLLALQTERALRLTRIQQAATSNPATLNPATLNPATLNPVRTILLADRADTFARAVIAPIGFRERLVTFWTNHFTVSVRQGPCRALAGAFRREAIEPHVTGRFGDMLLAVVRHPAMLHYLENTGSVGPDSRAGLRGHRGLNENLARECMELHTIGPASGYTQADVTSFAALLTGWSVQTSDLPYGFIFRPNAHQPGPKIVLGRTFPEGEEGGLDALSFFASHPATHAHLARRLVTHFGADDPDPHEIATIAALLRDTEGDLHTTSLALLDLPSARQPLTKLRSPNDWLVAAWRALALPPDDARPGGPGLLAYLGQPLFEAPLPNGWPDRAVDWAGPNPILRRADVAFHIASVVPPHRDPLDIAAASLGPLLRPTTRTAMTTAASRPEAIALLLTSPEFQRR